MQVRQIMTGDVECCTPQTDLPSVARKMAERDCGAIPVVESLETMRPVGIITDRDIAIRAVAKGQNPLDLNAGDCMSSSVVTVMPDTQLEDCLRIMEDNQIRRILVVDDQGKCCGILAQADIAQAATESDTAELVRDISEPNDREGYQQRYH